MKDKKFIILLILITVIALVNIVWLLSLQTKINKSLTPEEWSSQNSKSIYADQVTTKFLRLIDKNGNTCVFIGPESSIALFNRGGAQMQFSCTGQDGLAQIRLWNSSDFNYPGQLVITAGHRQDWPDIELFNAMGYRTVIDPYRVKHLPP